MKKKLSSLRMQFIFCRFSTEEPRKKEALALLRPLLKLCASRSFQSRSYSELKQPLENIDIQSLEKWNNSSILLRLENLSSKQQQIPDVTSLFRSKTFKKCQNANLIGQLPNLKTNCGRNVTLDPLGFKTFLLSW